MRSDRGINAACATPAILAHDLVEEALAHAVQALEFVVPSPASVWMAAIVNALWLANWG